EPLAGPRGRGYTPLAMTLDLGRPDESAALAATSQAPPESFPAAALPVLRVTLAAAPVPLVLRRDRLATGAEPSLDPADVLRYVGAARRTMRGPLVALVEGPGDPLA